MRSFAVKTFRHSASQADMLCWKMSQWMERGQLLMKRESQQMTEQ